MKIEIDLEEFAEQVRNGQSVTAKGGVLNDLLKQPTEMTLQAEIDSHIAQDLERNRKNGYSEKRMRTEHGEFQLKTPRDRNGSFVPQEHFLTSFTATSSCEEKPNPHVR